MTPVFVWVQKWLYWNRFKLILWASRTIMCLYIVFTCANVIYTFVDPAHLLGVFGVGGATLIWYLVFAKDHTKLIYASEHFEETGQITQWARKQRDLTRRSRPFMNILAIMLMSLICFWEFAGGSPELDDVFTLFFWLTFLAFMHLWEVPDVDPSERENMFEPKLGTDGA